MPHTDRTRFKRVAAATLGVALAGLLLGACGGSASGPSSSSSSASTAKHAPSPRSPSTPEASLRDCLQRNGVTLPKRKPGQPGVGASGPLGLAGTRRPPKGVTRAQLQAALKRCTHGRSGRTRKRAGSVSAARRQRLARFAACMRGRGVRLPPPNTSGNGPIFDTHGLDTKSAAFKSALSRCSRALAPGAPGSG
jgi:hypothetical protein